MNRACSLPTSKKEKKKDINHIKSVLAANSYPRGILKTSKKTKPVETLEQLRWPSGIERLSLEL